MKIVLTRDGSRTLYCEAAGESYHSESGAVTESRVVFLQNSGVQKRLADGVPTRVLEIGLGSGLNFLVTADQALRNGTSLCYTGIDTRRVAAAEFAELGYQALIAESGLYEWYRQSLREDDVSRNERFHEHVCLQHLTGRAESLVADPGVFPAGRFDAVYHDAFSPQVAGNLWSKDFLRHLHRVLKPRGILTTYCVKSEIQRRLKAVGFQVSCLSGPAGGKRQVLRATRQRGLEPVPGTQ